jgi:hypothetical protein
MNKLLILLLVIPALAFVGCGNDEDEMQALNREKQQISREVESQISALEKEIASLNSKAVDISDETNEQLDETIIELNEIRDELKDKLVEVQTAGTDTWTGLKQEIENSLIEAERYLNAQKQTADK